MTALRHNSITDSSTFLSAPHVVLQLLGACQGGIATPQSLQAIVLQDSALCVKILNSAVKTCPDRIDPSAPLTSALDGLGPASIKSLALQSARLLVETDLSAAQIQMLRTLWFDSQVAGITARYLAEAISCPAAEEAQLTALLTNVGMLSLFSTQPQAYLDTVDDPSDGAAVRAAELTRFDTDHLQIADQLICRWQLQSFMADAVSFQYQPVEQCRAASILVRMTRFCRLVCQSPLTLSDGVAAAGERLFNFNRSDSEYLFGLAEKQYRGLAPAPVEGAAEFNREKSRLTSLVFTIAEQDGCGNQLHSTSRAEQFAQTARQIFLQNTPATEAVLFALDAGGHQLVGCPAPQQRLLDGLKIALHGDSLLVDAVRTGQLQQLCETTPVDLSLFDRQLLRLCQGQGLLCIPLMTGDVPHGAIAVGINDAAAADHFSSTAVQMLAATVARALATLLGQNTDADTAQGDATDKDLIPKLVHEVSNPLTIIGNYMTVAGPLLTQTGNDELPTAIEAELKRIGDILRYYTEQKQAPQVAATPVDLNELLAAVVESLRPSFFAPKNITVLTDFDDSVQPLRSKPVVIKQILVNLLKNAAEALADDGQIALSSREIFGSDGCHFVEVTVRDNGPGIDKAVMEKLFSPVTSTKGGDHAGLGLNIVKGMADDLGARISCHSSAEFGTCFNLLIPRMDEID
ncbi:MAG: hypothetical protein C0618_02425 [Desulfuromonas sp.]|nr:MAG: hypothetical protein C0618_02425 [Desulfuromonas sp.]